MGKNAISGLRATMSKQKLASRIAGIALGAIALAVATPNAQAAPSLFVDQYVNSGFIVAKNGFSFSNWGGITEYDALAFKQMGLLFAGAANCHKDEFGAHCDVRGGNRIDLNHINEHLAQGRCEGMVVLAARLYKHPANIAGISKRAHNAAQLTKDEAEHQIAFWWATQLSPTIGLESLRTVGFRPSEIGRLIFESLSRREMVSLGVYTESSGHTVLPISVNETETQFVVRLYDPNQPRTVPKLVIDKLTESWSITPYVATTGTPGSIRWSGPGRLDVVPISSRSRIGNWSLLVDF
jgi:hypothetical protein